MRVTIDHSEIKAGLVFRKTMYQVATRIEFSPAELDTIKKRKLDKTVIMKRGIPANKNPNSFKDGLEDTFDLTIYTLRSGTDTYVLESPLSTKKYDDELKQSLRGLKDFLEGNATSMEGRSTFEL